ncbi:hypothetical protein [Nonomuraea sp. NPDC023979]|uniref:hypothetical protein n=1 Tax=Nonomuraea sp. NPDC023979 TaxID=3154796 RepID=UPI0033CC7532
MTYWLDGYDWRASGSPRTNACWSTPPHRGMSVRVLTADDVIGLHRMRRAIRHVPSHAADALDGLRNAINEAGSVVGHCIRIRESCRACLSPGRT